MNKCYQWIAMIGLTSLPLSVFAHSGHDHSDSSASLIHLLWAAPAALAVVLAYKLFSVIYAKKTSVTSQK